MSVAIPTAADLNALVNGEIYGLRQALQTGETNWEAADLFLHGRDFFCPMPDSFQFSGSADQQAFTRVYRLMADNVFDVDSNWTGRTAFVSPERLRLFQASLLGYPYTMNGGDGKLQLFRHLPEPFRAGTGGLAWTFLDTRTGGSIQRFEFHASKIVRVWGEVPGAQGGGTPITWNPTTQSAIWDPNNPGTFNDPNEGYESIHLEVMFERLPYNVMQKVKNGGSADAAYAGEYSRFVIYPEKASARALQIRAGVQWDTADGQGQPASGNRVSGTFSSLEGAPKLVGENTITWKWIDVPELGANWANPTGSGAIEQAGLKAYFGYVNDSNFGDSTHLPIVFWNEQSVLFRTCERSEQKPSCIGFPVYDYTFVFQHAPANDGLGYWNRLLNPNGYYQRYQSTLGGNWYNLANIPTLFKTKDYF